MGHAVLHKSSCFCFSIPSIPHKIWNARLIILVKNPDAGKDNLKVVNHGCLARLPVEPPCGQGVHALVPYPAVCAIKNKKFLCPGDGFLRSKRAAAG